MKPKLIFCLALIMSGGSLLIITGCRGMGTQTFTAYAMRNCPELTSIVSQ